MEFVTFLDKVRGASFPTKMAMLKCVATGHVGPQEQFANTDQFNLVPNELMHKLTCKFGNDVCYTRDFIMKAVGMWVSCGKMVTGNYEVVHSDIAHHMTPGQLRQHVVNEPPLCDMGDDELLDMIDKYKVYEEKE